MLRHAAALHGLGPRPQSGENLSNIATTEHGSKAQIVQWNIHGLLPEKLLATEVVALIDAADVMIFTETWLDGDEQIPDSLQSRFICYAVHGERQLKGRGVGGVLVCVKRGIGQSSVFKLNPRAGIVWVKFCRSGDMPRDLFLGACYLQPHGSKVLQRLDVNPHDHLEADIIQIAALGDIILAGDLNARSGSRAEDGVDINGVNAILATMDPELDFARELLGGCRNVKLPPRVSMDRTVNACGRRLLSTCSMGDLAVLNGRLPGDGEGRFTFKSKARVNACSVVDYFIATPTLAFQKDGLPLNVTLTVNQHEAFRLHSDHWPVSLVLSMDVLGVRHTVAAVKVKGTGKRHRHRGGRKHAKPEAAVAGDVRWKWDPDLADAYTLALQQDSYRLEEVMNQEGRKPEELIEMLKAVVHGAARRAGLLEKPLVNSKSENGQQRCSSTSAVWYGQECREAYKRLQKIWAAKRASMRATGLHVTEVVWREERQAMRSYQLTVRRSKRRYTRERQAYLADILKHKPQHFWRLAKLRPKQADGLTKQAWHTYFSNLRNPLADAKATPTHALKFVAAAPTIDALQHAKVLNGEFTEQETVVALEHVKSGKAADRHGDIMELFSKAVVHGRPLLAPQLTKVINSVFMSGVYPQQESVGMIIPLYKGKDSEADGSNYRGITIITAMSKLYATMLNNRLVAWRADSSDRQAMGQAGFTKDRRTVDHAFALQHVIHKQCRALKKGERRQRRLYTCFVDLSKAFDTIDRQKLWARMGELGVHGNMLQALKAYYADVQECVRTSEGLTDSFKSDVGVKQGCPLSPTLFGFFIDKVEGFIRDICAKKLGGQGVHIGTNRVPMLIYADDIVFMATSESELQFMMGLFTGFCDMHGLTVNVGKTAVVVFSQEQESVQPKANIFYKGSRIQQLDEYKYLGIFFHWQKGAKKGGELMLQVANKALHAMHRQARAEQICSPIVLCRMFDTLIFPIMAYGCEVWGFHTDLLDKADRMHTDFLKRILGLPGRTDTWSVLAELNRQPLSNRMVERIAVFSDRIRGMRTQERLHAWAAVENFGWLREKQARDANCWCMRAAMCMGKACNGAVHLESMSAATVKAWMDCEAARVFQKACIDGVNDRRELYGSTAFVRADGHMKRTYTKWFGHGATAARAVQNPGLCKKLMRFRLGAHGLDVVTGAWNGGVRVPREQRVCRLCDMGKVEDEAHLVLECPHYYVFRLAFADLFVESPDNGHVAPIANSSTDSMMSRFFQQNNQRRVARFLSLCLDERKRMLSFLEQN